MKPGNVTLKGTAFVRYYDNQSGSIVETVEPNHIRYNQSVICDPLVKGNWKAPNPWFYVVDRGWSPKGTYYTNSVAFPHIFLSQEGLLGDQNICQDWPGYSSWQSLVEQTALERLNDRVRGSLDLATSLAEAGQTAKMLNLVQRFKAGVVDMKRSYAREIADKIRSFRGRRDAEKALRRWQDGLRDRHPGSYNPVPPKRGLVDRLSGLAANGWCEFTYGWKPLISDIRGIAENVVGHVRNNDVIKVKVTREINVTRPNPITIGGYSAVHDCKLTGFTRVTYGIRLKPNWDEGLAKWSSLNPLSVAWELIPYSFVVDWFLDIGSYMRNLETSLLYANNFRDGYKSVLSVINLKLEASGSQIAFGQRYAVFGLTAERRVSIFQRSVLSAYPTPSIPSFQVDLGSSQLLSAAALLRQLLR